MSKISNVKYKKFNRDGQLDKIERDILDNADNISSIDLLESSVRILVNNNYPIDRLLKVSNNSKMKATGLYLGIPQCHVISINLLSGYTCPAANLCMALTKKDRNSLNKTGTTLIKNTLTDGTDKIGYCYAAEEENQYTHTFNARLYNTQLIHDYNDNIIHTAYLIIKSILANRVQYVRIHSAGGMKNTSYMIAWIIASRILSDYNVKVFGYTKVLPYVTGQFRALWSDNFKLQYSFGGLFDNQLTYDNQGIPTIPTAFVKISPADNLNIPLSCPDEDNPDDITHIFNEVSFYLPLH